MLIIVFHALEFVLIAMRLKKCVKKLSILILCNQFVPYRYKTQEMCDKVVFEELFILKCYLDRYKASPINLNNINLDDDSCDDDDPEIIIHVRLVVM